MVTTPVDTQEKLFPQCSAQLLQALDTVQNNLKRPAYLVGGTIRNWIVGSSSLDIDIAVPGSALSWAQALQKQLSGGTLIDLSGPEDETFRLVWRDEQIDISSFRAGSSTIEDDLRLRDFTINALAMKIVAPLTNEGFKLIDPTGGMEDLESKSIHHLPGAFTADPLRVMRGYRLFAQFGFSIEEATRRENRVHRELLETVAAERISYELKLIFESPRTSATLALMAEDGVLALLLPELYYGEGVVQPEFHHLDVMHHCLLALEMMECIIADPERFYPGHGEIIQEYLDDGANCRCLKWAALVHDIGKPATRKAAEHKDGRVTFYRHDEVGSDIFAEFAKRAKWSGGDSDKVGNFIRMHMHPFHLCNASRTSPLTKRAALKLTKRAGEDLVGLFLLAMSDSLASQGEKKPEKMEDELATLFSELHEIFIETIAPVLHGPKLLSGYDLINHFHLDPGPLFGRIFLDLESARVEGVVGDKEGALRWVENYLKKNNISVK